MIQLVENLYVGASIRDVSTIVYALKHNITVAGVYCICFRENPKPRMEILSAKELLSERNQKLRYILAGIAQNKKEAVDLLTFMVQSTILDGRDGANPQEWLK